jgi:hypothetical protein
VLGQTLTETAWLAELQSEASRRWRGSGFGVPPDGRPKRLHEKETRRMQIITMSGPANTAREARELLTAADYLVLRVYPAVRAEDDPRA